MKIEDDNLRKVLHDSVKSISTIVKEGVEKDDVADDEQKKEVLKSYAGITSKFKTKLSKPESEYTTDEFVKLISLCKVNAEFMRRGADVYDKQLIPTLTRMIASETEKAN